MYVPSSRPAARSRKSLASNSICRMPACENLERRLLFAAAVTAPLPLQQVPENTVTSIDLSTSITDPANPGATFTFSAVSDNLQLVNPTVSGTILTFNPAPGRSGFAHVTVSGTDAISSATVTEKVLVEVVPSAARSLEVTLGSGHSRTVTYTDADGTHGSVTLDGPGSAVVDFGGDQMQLSAGGSHVAGSNVAVMGVDATGTTAATKLVIRGSGRRIYPLIVGPIATTGAFGSVAIHDASLAGGLSAAAGFGALNIDYASSATFTSSAVAIAGRSISIVGKDWEDVNLDAAAPISTLRITSWDNSDNVSESVVAPSIRSVKSLANFTPGLQLSGTGAPGGRALGTLKVGGYIGGVWNVPGHLAPIKVGGTDNDFNATFDHPISSFILTGSMGGALTVPAIGNLQVRGSLNGVTLTLSGPLSSASTDLRSLKVKDTISGSTISSAGDITAISAESVNGSSIYAGVGTIASGGALPMLSTDFASAARIGSVIISPRRRVIGFVNSVIAAESLGTLSLATVNVSNNGTAFGVAGASIRSLTARDSFKQTLFSFKNITAESQVAAVISAKNLDLADFNVIVV